MSQINLVLGSADAPRKNGLNRTIFISLALFVLPLGFYFGMLTYKSFLRKNTLSLETSISEQKNLIAGDTANRVADFSDRLVIVDDILKETKSSPNGILEKIESAMMPVVNVVSYEYDMEKKNIVLKISADSFRSVVEQIVTLKASFTSVMIDGNVSINKDGKVESTLNITP